MTVAAPEVNLLTVREVAELLRVSPKTVRAMIAARELEAIRLRPPGGPVRVHAAAVERLVAPRAAGGGSGTAAGGGLHPPDEEDR
jgi:excisionase family DNA binding protein